MAFRRRWGLGAAGPGVLAAVSADLPFAEFACEEGVFFAASQDEEIMRKPALGLSGLLRERPEEARRML